jgi:hypothetical protein
MNSCTSHMFNISTESYYSNVTTSLSGVLILTHRSVCTCIFYNVKVKLSLYTPYESLEGECRYSSAHSYPRPSLMPQLIYPRTKRARWPLYRRLSGSHGPVWTFRWKEKIYLPCIRHCLTGNGIIMFPPCFGDAGLSSIACRIGRFHPFYRPRRSLGRVRGIALLCFYTSALEGDEGSASRPGRFLRPRKTRYPLYRRLDGPQGRSGLMRKISPPPGFDPRTFQPVASRYTD